MMKTAHCSGVDVAGWTVDREIQVRFLHTLTVCGAFNGKEDNDVFGRPRPMSG